jgi:hypothetical protein
MTLLPTARFDIPRYAERGPASLNLLNNPKNMEVRAPAGICLACATIYTTSSESRSTVIQKVP